MDNKSQQNKYWTRTSPCWTQLFKHF